MNKAAEEKLNTLLKDVLKVKKISDDLSINNVPNWDSLVHLQLLSKIDETFGIDVEFEDSLTMTSVKAIKDVVGKYVKKKQ